jgi:hypothetical protein
MENARKESISKNYTTNTVYPSSLSHSFSLSNSNPKFFVKAIVPISKQFYEQTFPSNSKRKKPQFILYN